MDLLRSIKLVVRARIWVIAVEMRRCQKVRTVGKGASMSMCLLNMITAELRQIHSLG